MSFRRKHRASPPYLPHNYAHNLYLTALRAKIKLQWSTIKCPTLHSSVPPLLKSAQPMKLSHPAQSSSFYHSEDHQVSHPKAQPSKKVSHPRVGHFMVLHCTTMKALVCRIAAVSTMARAILHFHSFTLQTSLKRIKMTIALLIAYSPTKDLLQHILTQNYSKRNEDLFSSSDLLSRCYHLLDCTRVCKAQQSSKNQRYLVGLVLVPTCFPPYLAGGFMGATPPQ